MTKLIKKISERLMMCESITALSQIFIASLILTSLLGCSGGKESKTSSNSDICFGASLIYLDNSRKNIESTIANNEFACEKCYARLSNEEREICDME